ncbi:hypothetical protein [Candidatus Poriferisodalis sp.]|uniref:hypothetical protein n=1 Tax=Candidatus Poriferisodalis sp. TaxID=3101277 RepID=UPI003D0F7B17
MAEAVELLIRDWVASQVVGDLAADAVVQHAGTATSVAIEFKTRVNGASAQQLARQAQQLAMPMVVIGREMTRAARAILAEAGVGSVDGLGNVHLTLPGLIMRTTGESRARPAQPRSRLSGKSSLVAQAMLLDTDRLVDEICDGLERTGTEYALTGTAAVARISPLLTNVPVVEVWLNATADPDAVCESLQAQPVESGPNLVILQERNDAPLAFRTRQRDKWIANVFRLYVDVRRDPQRGREQADHLRREVIGF